MAYNINIKVMKKSMNNKGFTLVELIVVIAIIGVLAAVLAPNYLAYVDKSRTAADSHNLEVLNDATKVYLVGEPSPNAFEMAGQSNDTLMQLLIDEGILSQKPLPQQKDMSFAWDLSQKLWLLVRSGTVIAHEITSSEVPIEQTGGMKGTLGWNGAEYSGTATDILIPKEMDGIAVSGIYQDTFKGKGLTSVSFPMDGSLTRLHARSFMNNKLTELVLPPSITRLDYGAFMDNDITKVTIGAGVYLEGNVFCGNNDFKLAYEAGGEGTYVFKDGKWEKQ